MLGEPLLPVPSSMDGQEPRKGNDLAARTDDILAIVGVQFEAMEPGPKLIMGDLNGTLDSFPTAMALIRNQGWTDIGNDKPSAMANREWPLAKLTSERKQD